MRKLTPQRIAVLIDADNLEVSARETFDRGIEYGALLTIAAVRLAKRVDSDECILLSGRDRCATTPVPQSARIIVPIAQGSRGHATEEGD